MSKHNGVIFPVTFFDKLIRKNELGQPFTLMDHQREVLRLAFDFDQTVGCSGICSSIAV